MAIYRIYHDIRVQLYLRDRTIAIALYTMLNPCYTCTGFVYGEYASRLERGLGLGF